MLTENTSAQELAAIVVGVSATVVLLLTTAVTVIYVALCVRRRTRMNNLLTTSTNVAYQSRGGHNTHHNLPLPLLPFQEIQTDCLPNGALPSDQDPPLGAVSNVAYGLLQNGTESLNLEQNISYGAYTEGQDDDYALVSNGYGTTVRKVTLSSNQD